MHKDFHDRLERLSLLSEQNAKLAQEAESAVFNLSAKLDTLTAELSATNKALHLVAETEARTMRRITNSEMSADDSERDSF